MIIDFRKIARSGKTEQSFYFEFTPDNSVIDIPDAEFSAPVKVNGTATLTDMHSAYIEGEITFKVKANCTRCLSPTEKEFITDFAEQVSSDEDSYPVKCDTVDLTKIVEDKIIMTIPVSFLCKEDCKGICFSCGKNLNDGECECEK